MFDEDYLYTILVLNSSNYSYTVKENTYHDFLEKYPFYDSTKLDHIEW